MQYATAEKNARTEKSQKSHVADALWGEASITKAHIFLSKYRARGHANQCLHANWWQTGQYIEWFKGSHLFFLLQQTLQQ